MGEVKDAREHLRKIEKRLAERIAERDDLLEKRERKEARDPEDDKRARKLDREISKLTVEIRGVRPKVRKLRRKEGKAEAKLEKAKERKSRTPRIIDLDLDFRPMAGQASGINKVIGHHTAGPTDDDLDDAIRLCRQYHAAHKAKGWAGEGYHLCIARSGEILLLRPFDSVGAHTYGYNTGSLGFMCHGTTGDKPTEAQAAAIRWLAQYGHTNEMPRSHRAPTKLANLRWYGHSRFNSTACPGTHLDLFESRGAKR